MTSMHETSMLDFGDLYSVFCAFLMSIALRWYWCWQCNQWFSLAWKSSSKRQDAKSCKNIGKLSLFEYPRNVQEALIRLNIDHDKDAWNSDMRFWWPLLGILLILWNYRMKIETLKDANLAKVLVFHRKEWGCWGQQDKKRKKVSKRSNYTTKFGGL